MKKNIYDKEFCSWKEWLKLKNKGYTGVSGCFDYSNQGLSSLEGAPEYVGGKL